MGSGFSSDTSVQLVASKQPQRPIGRNQPNMPKVSTPKKPENAAEDLRASMKVIETGIDKLEKELSCPVW